MLTESELRSVLKARGWSMSRKRVKGYYSYSAVRRIPQALGGGRKEIYLCSSLKLVSRSDKDIVAKLS